MVPERTIPRSTRGSRDDDVLLRDAAFVVVDTETTGLRSSMHRVIEIGAVRVLGERIVGRYRQFIDPGCAVPAHITRLTGITNGMVFGQPSFGEACPGFLEFLACDVFTAHNLSFDLRFLNAECRQAGYPEITNRKLCTLRLARRLLPGLRSKGLAGLMDHYGIDHARRHRAEADAKATAQVLLRLLDRLRREHGIQRLSEVLAFQYRRYGDLKREPGHVVRLRRDVLPLLPESPGVYLMKDAWGQTIYVGKSRNLSNRVRSYFASMEGHAPHVRRLVARVRTIEWQVADSEFDALKEESRLIKEHRPRYNRAHLQYVNRPFIRIDANHAYPGVRASAFVHDDGAEYYGPMRSRDEARFVIEVIGRFFGLRECTDADFAGGRRCAYAAMKRCSAPCEEAQPRYADEVDRVRAFLLGKDDFALARIEQAMRASSEERDYEQARMYRDWLGRLQRMFEKREAVASRVLAHDAVIVHREPGRSPCLLVVYRGRHVETVPVERSLDCLEAVLERYFVRGVETPPVYREQEVDELHLLSHWLYVHRDEVSQISWKEAGSVAVMVDMVRVALESCTDARRKARRPTPSQNH